MPDTELVEKVEETLLQADPLVTTGAELSRELDKKKSRIFDALRVLEYNGDAANTSTGANAVAWWHTDRVVPPGGPGAAREGLFEDMSRPSVDDADPVASDDLLEDVEEHVRHALPTRGKSPDDVDAMLDAVRAALKYILEYEEAGQQDLERALYDDHSGPYGSTNSWYKRMLKPGLRAAIESGEFGINIPESAGEKWEARR
jgi:hypothetical protein